MTTYEHFERLLKCHISIRDPIRGAYIRLDVPIIIKDLKDILTTADLNLALKMTPETHKFVSDRMINFMNKRSYERKDALITELLKYIVPDDSNLLTALSHWKLDVVQQIYNTVKIQPTDEHILYAVQNQNYRLELLTMLVNFKLRLTHEHLDTVLNSRRSNVDLIELFIDNGVQLTKEDVVRAVQMHIEIKDPERFGVVIDDAFVKVCAEANFYPSYVNNFTIQTLEIACSFPRNLVTIKSMIKQAKLVPNLECLRQACRTGDLPTIRFLLKYVEPDYSCWIEGQKNQSKRTCRQIDELLKKK